MKKAYAATCICLLISILSMAFYGISDKYSEKFIPAVVTLSSEQLEGITYTEATKYDDSDLWENGDGTYSYSQNGSDTETVSTVNFPIDINIASAEELTNIKGIGISTAEKIISYRENKSYFSSLDDLLNVDGIGEKTLDKMREYIYISPEFEETVTSTNIPEETSVTVSSDDVLLIELNSATKEELMQIDGIGDVTADAILEYAGTVGFRDVSDLMNVKGIGEKKLEKISPYVYVEK